MERRPARARRPRRLGLLMLAWFALAIRLALGAGAEAPLQTAATSGPLAALAAATVDCGPEDAGPKTPKSTGMASPLVALDHDAEAAFILPPAPQASAPAALLAGTAVPWNIGDRPRPWKRLAQARAPPAEDATQPTILMNRPV